MSAQPDAAAEQKISQRVRRPFFCYVLIVAIASIYLFPFMRFVLSGSDEGSILLGAERIVHGQVFARDFFELMGPGSFYLAAAWFKCFGASFASARVYLFLTFLLTAMILYCLSRRICGRLALLPLAVFSGTYFGMFSGGVSHHFDSNVYALLAILCLIHWQSKKRALLLVAAGAFLGVSTCVMQPKGVLLLCAALLWIWIEAKTAKTRTLSLFTVAGSFVFVLGAVVIYFWSQGALADLVYADFVFPSQQYGSLNSVPYAFSLFGGVWDFWRGVFGPSIWGRSISAVMLVPGILVALLPVLTPILALRYKFKVDMPESLLLWLSGYALWLSEVHRADIFHLTFGSTILIILFSHFLGRWQSPISRTATGIIYFGSVALAVCSFLILALGAKPITTRAGTITSIQPNVSEVLANLEKNSTPGQDVFIYPYSPIYYFLSGTRNPTRYSIMMYGYNTPDQFREAIKALDERKVRFVVWDTNFAKIEKQLNPNAPVMKPDDLLMEPYLAAHYLEVANYGGVRLMERTAVTDAGGPANGADFKSEVVPR